MYEHLEEVENPFQYLLMMLEELVATDIYSLQKIEKKMNGFEEEILKEKELPFFYEIPEMFIGAAFLL